MSAKLDPDVSRGLWLVKWILAIPHYVILLVLWTAFAALSLVAFVCILATGRYPRGIFDFNVGVMRWTWRVTFYAYGALGTDRYPPFTLADVPSYPAHLDVVYPEHLSRGLALVKWWLLALPHYLVVAFFISGGLFAAGASSDNSQPILLGGGLVGILVLIAAISLLVTGRYPKSIFDLITGLQRWVIRVAGYAALMTDVYPPFRLDQGGEDLSFATDSPAPEPPRVSGATRKRAVLPTVIGTLAIVGAVILGVASTALFEAGRTLPDKDGFLMTPDMSYHSDGYAITSEAVGVGTERLRTMAPDKVFGDAKLVVSSDDEGAPLFVGVASTKDVNAYLSGVARSTLVTVEITNGKNQPTYRETSGSAPRSEPGLQDIWTASSEGVGDQAISFPVASGSWTVVVMRSDGSREVSADVRAGATLPIVGWLVAVLAFSTGFLLLLGMAMLIGGSRSARKEQAIRAPAYEAQTR
ncbi:MAG: DUF4389 domain-containing protein [Aeromicrobium sp.]